MKPQHKRLIREQLETTLEKLSCLRSLQRPAKGWLRAIREGLGMSGKQFSRRLGVSPPRISALEKDELSGSVSLKTMRQAAEALDCVFVYAVIPRESLTDTVRKRARSLAEKRLARVSHSMLLEAQQLTDDEQQNAFDAEVEELVRNMPKELWNDHHAV
ncbi:MAG TPA: mobile mystery protein A [Desulfobulbus sp.]|nr:mobile mystery protein A [Desulfobulbus sp.]